MAITLRICICSQWWAHGPQMALKSWVELRCSWETRCIGLDCAYGDTFLCCLPKIFHSFMTFSAICNRMLLKEPLYKRHLMALRKIINCTKQVKGFPSMNFVTQLVANLTLGKKVTMHLVTTMLATSKNVLFPGPNHLITTGADDVTLWLSPKCQHVKGHQYRW